MKLNTLKRGVSGVGVMCQRGIIAVLAEGRVSITFSLGKQEKLGCKRARRNPITPAGCGGSLPQSRDTLLEA